MVNRAFSLWLTTFNWRAPEVVTLVPSRTSTVFFLGRFSPSLEGSAGRPMRPRKGWPLAASSSGPWSILREWSDMELVALNPELGAYFGTDTGVLVVRGPLEDESLGLESGDVILRIGDREVKSPEHAMRILRSYEREEDLTIDIVRHKKSQTLTGTIPRLSGGFVYGDYFKHPGD